MTATMPSTDQVGLGYQVRFRHYDSIEVNELCTYCRRPMADGGAPLPGEGRGVNDRACATCHSRHLQGLPLITTPTSQKPEPACDHGVPLSEPCTPCDEEIEAQEEEVID